MLQALNRLEEQQRSDFFRETENRFFEKIRRLNPGLDTVTVWTVRGLQVRKVTPVGDEVHA